MTERRTYSDEELTAWLDGETAHAPADEIEQAMAGDPDLRARVERLSVDLTAMRSAFDGLLSHAPSAPDLGALPQIEATPKRANALLAMAAAVTLIAAGSVGYFAAERKDDSWRGFVAAYQALYVSDTLASLNRSEETLAAELSRVTAAIGKSIDPANLTSGNQLAYKRAQILGFEGRPLIQLAFVSTAGTPVALCIIRSDGAGKQAPAIRTMEGMSAASWSNDGYEYLLIGGADDALIETAAKGFAARI